MSKIKETDVITDKDMPVGKIYESFDYDSFKIIAQNRGSEKTNGVVNTKIKQLNQLVDNDEYIPELALTWINLRREIVNGRHAFEYRKLNKWPIRFIITADPRFNVVSKADLVLGGMFPANKGTSKWTSANLYNAALELNTGLAKKMELVISQNNNTFKWKDLLALLLKREDFFAGKTDAIPSKIFKNKTLIEQFEEPEFQLELKYFIKLNNKARAAIRKAVFLKASYEIIFRAKDIMDVKLVRKALLTIPDEWISSKGNMSLPKMQKTIINWVNKECGKDYVASTIFFEIKNHLHKNSKIVVEEEAMEAVES